MADEVHTTRETRAAPETTTVIHEVRSGGGAGWVIVVLLAVALVGGFWLFGRSTASQSHKDNAIATAAENVGEAAKDVGDAAHEAAKNVNKP